MEDTAGEAGTSSLEMYSYWPPYMAVQKQDDQHEHTFSSYVRIRDAVLRTCLGRWTIERSGERGSGISVLPARHDDDDTTCQTEMMNIWQIFFLDNRLVCMNIKLKIARKKLLIDPNVNNYKTQLFINKKWIEKLCNMKHTLLFT